MVGPQSLEKVESPGNARANLRRRKEGGDWHGSQEIEKIEVKPEVPKPEPQALPPPPKINASEVAKIQSGKGRRSKANLASLLAASIKGQPPPPVDNKNRATDFTEKF